MATLSGSSTLAEIQTSYGDNASYAEDASMAKAKAFLTACRLLLLRLPKSGSSGASTVAMNPELIAAQLEACNAWIAANGGTAATANAGVRHFSLENFRE